MRLLFVSNLFPDTTQPWRGLDNVTLLHAMKAARPDAEIRVLCLRPSQNYWLGKDCSLKPRPGDEVFQPIYGWAPYVPRLGGLNDILFARAIRRAARGLPPGWQPEALLVPWLFPDGCAVNRIESWSRLPMLAIAQGSDVHRYLEMPMRRRAVLRLAQRAQIATRSGDLRLRLLKAGAAPDCVHTVYNGVDTATFCPGDKTAARRALQLPETGGIALFVGNFVPVKGMDLLVRAFGRARECVPGGARLVLIGSGPLEKELVALARSCGLDADHFRLAGRRPPAEVAQFMRAADVVCLSSHNEGVPNVILEALAAGRPVVSTDVGGIAEVLGAHKDAGKLLPTREVDAYASALATLLENPPDQHRVAAHAASYTWPRCAASCWALVTKNADLLYAEQ